MASYGHVAFCLFFCFQKPPQLTQPSDSSPNSPEQDSEGAYRRPTPMNPRSNTGICGSKVELHQQPFHFVPTPSILNESFELFPFQLSWAEGTQAAISLGHNKHLVSLAEQIKPRVWVGNKTILFCFVLTVWNVKIPRRISSLFLPPPLPDRAWNHSAVFPPLHNNLPL